MAVKTAMPLKSYADFIERYNQELNRLDEIFGKYRQCKSKCPTCCHSLIKISYIEAYSLKKGFQQLSSKVQTQILHNVWINNFILKTDPSKKDDLICPLLSDDNCSLYDYKPLLCTSFGFPIFNEETVQLKICPLNAEAEKDPRFTFLNSVSMTMLTTELTLLSAELRIEKGLKVSIDEDYSYKNVMDVLLDKSL